MSYKNFRNNEQSFIIDYLNRLGKFKSLGLNLVASDLRTRFRRSYLGILWAVIQPMTYALIIGYVWKNIFGAESYLEFALFLYSGLIVWEFFATTASVSLDTFKNSEGYLKQGRIPLLIFQVRVPLSALTISLLSLIGLFVFQYATGQPPTLGLHTGLLIPYFIVLILFGAPIAIIMSIVGSIFRDAQYIVGLGIQALFFLSPVIIQRQLLEQQNLLFLKYANPMVPLIYMFRDITTDAQIFNLADFKIVIFWIIGLWICALLMTARYGRRAVFLL